ncbi:MAG: B12-binding domain-containing radical SAM protein [Candidatus Saccharibacteria bacterium]
MKILLVYPLYPQTFWSFRYCLKFVARKAAFPPLGLLTVASLLPPDWEKRLADENVAPITDEQLLWADLVMVSAMIVQKSSAERLIERAQALGKVVVAGGPLFSSQPDKFPQVDHLVLNEAEVTLPQFLADWFRGKPKPRYESGKRPPLSATPIPMWSLVKLRDYATLLVQYSRGCPFDCEFCDITVMNGRNPRVKSVAQMMAEFDALYDLGWRGSVFVVDDNFIGNRREVRKMLPELVAWQKRHRYPFKFLTEASVNLAGDVELMTLMSKANFGDLFLGLETPCAESLQEAGKTQNAGLDLRSAVNELQRRGFTVMGGFMVGFDHDNPQTIFRDQLAFIQEAGVPVAMVGMVMALPGTRLWQRLRDEGRLIKESSGSNTTGETNFLPVMGMDNLVNGYRDLLLSLYSAKNYFRRVETELRNYRSKIVGRCSLNDLAALFKSAVHIGILSEARWRYWRLLAKTALTRPKAMHIAVQQAILWPHFRKVALLAQGQQTDN